MAFVRTSRLLPRAGQPHFVPGGMACAASARRTAFVPTVFPLSATLKRVSGALVLPLRRTPLT